jgi:hypothetical protein
MNFPRVTTLPACLLLAICGAGCGSSSSFFMIRNPFQAEADALANLKARSALKRSAEEAGPDLVNEPPPQTVPPDSRRGSYFGREINQASDPAFFARKDAPPAPPEPAGEPATSPPPVPLSRKETVATPRPAATGAVCYRCNGKGHHLSSLSAEGRLVECTDCGGTGRR